MVCPFVFFAFSPNDLKEKFTIRQLAKIRMIFYNSLVMVINIISVYKKLSESVIGNWLYLKVAASIK